MHLEVTETYPKEIMHDRNLTQTYITTLLVQISRQHHYLAAVVKTQNLIKSLEYKDRVFILKSEFLKIC